MLHGTLSREWIPFCWCELPRWKEQLPWTAKVPRHRLGRRTSQIHPSHHQAGAASYGAAQSQLHSSQRGPVYKVLGKEAAKYNELIVEVLWLSLWASGGGRASGVRHETHLLGNGGLQWQWPGKGCDRHKHRAQSEPQNTWGQGWQRAGETAIARDLHMKHTGQVYWRCARNWSSTIILHSLLTMLFLLHQTFYTHS